MSGIPIMLLYILLFVAIFYFLAVRPQRRQKAQHKEMLEAMKKGDEVVTVGGMYGTVRKIGDDWVDLDIAPHTRVRFLKRAISTIHLVEEEEEEEYLDEEVAEDDEGYDELEAGDEEEYDEEQYEEEEVSGEAQEEAEESEVEAPEAPPAPEPPKKRGSRRR